MTIEILIAHAPNEEDEAEKLAGSIRDAGYKVAHSGTVCVGESIIEEASKLLVQNCPVVVCGTVRAMGTKWARKIANAARMHSGTRVFVVQMEEDADTEVLALGETVAHYWKDPQKAQTDLVGALRKYYPLDGNYQQTPVSQELELRYRKLALKACDIIDLANLPEDDRHLASRELELRRLYVALRMRLENDENNDAEDDFFQQLEQRRFNYWGNSERGAEATDDKLVSLGERLEVSGRLIVLGDPGAGKSTLLRWLATAYLLRLQNDPDWMGLPDIASLPGKNLLPILIRCRDLPPQADTLDSMLYHSLRKSEIAEEHCEPMRKFLRKNLEGGDALLLVDGLDEITEPAARSKFAEQLEKIHRAFPNAPMVVTSRIVGYREMGYRIRSGFEHLTVADLTHADKDDFSRRWCALTERSERCDEAAKDLIHDIHSSDRIERLTGNPMLLTTMALIKRKIGRLPQRRVDLYEKSVEVLLNWRSAVDAALDPREALPQLEYLAYAMCADGIQQIREDQAIGLFRQARNDYPHIHALQQHTPEEFLTLLERRTGLLVQSGYTRHNGKCVAVHEFRHLTFQEYLAAIALVQGHYRERNKSLSLDMVLAPLAGQVDSKNEADDLYFETLVVENWREVIRLVLSACNDDVADKALLAVLHRMDTEKGTERARLILAAHCLTDEPNVSDVVAKEVIQCLATEIETNQSFDINANSLSAVAIDLGRSRWAAELDSALLKSFLGCPSTRRTSPGSVYSAIQEGRIPTGSASQKEWHKNLLRVLGSSDKAEVVGASLSIMQAAFCNKLVYRRGLADKLIPRLVDDPSLSHAAAWALGWMAERGSGRRKWKPNINQENAMLEVVKKECDDETLFWLSRVFKITRNKGAFQYLVNHLPNSTARSRPEIISALGKIGHADLNNIISPYLTDSMRAARQAALKVIMENQELDDIDFEIMGVYRNPRLHWGLYRDPIEKISIEDIKEIADQFALTTESVYERMLNVSKKIDFKLQLPKIRINNKTGKHRAERNRT